MNVRWLIRSDMPQVLDIENSNSYIPWDDDQFINFLSQRNGIGLVVELDDRVVGYMLYELHSTNLYLVKFAAKVCDENEKILQAMFNQMRSKLSPDRRTKLRIDVLETDLSTQLFLKSQGFYATNVLQDYFPNGRDAYSMEYAIA